MAQTRPGKPGAKAKQKGGGAESASGKGRPASSHSPSRDPKKKPSLKDAPKARLRYITSSPDLGHCPEDDRPEVALIGRSNAGKSSVLNGIGNERVAQVSSTPGKTRFLNFFAAGDSYRFVDMPGYGYSARPGEEHRAWKPMIESYLGARANLCGLLVLLDVRRDWSEDEARMLAWLAPRQLPAAVILTKVDKVSRAELETRMRKARSDSGIENVFPTSALKKTGFHELEDFVFRQWVKPRLKR